jgi:hemin uptake protein HemP
MKPLELKPEDLPIIVKLKAQDGTKEYVLIGTKQGKLLLNKPMGGARG